MKKFLSIVALCIAFINLNAQHCTKPFHIVILGSSTAAGDGVTTPSKAWAYMYADSLKRIDTGYVVDNLAVAGTTTYDAQGDGYVPPLNRPLPMHGHNITAAIDLKPDAIIINYPTNDAANNFSLTEQENNFKRITNRAAKFNILVWVATTQPRNNFDSKQVSNQRQLYNWIMSYYGTHAINFQNGLATSADSILHYYDSGDGVHLNNDAHQKLYNRVLKAGIPDTLCSRAAPIAATLPKLKAVKTIAATY